MSFMDIEVGSGRLRAASLSELPHGVQVVKYEPRLKRSGTQRKLQGPLEIEIWIGWGAPSGSLGQRDRSHLQRKALGEERAKIQYLARGLREVRLRLVSVLHCTII